MWLNVIITIILAVFFATKKRYRWLYILYKTLPRDLKAMLRFIKVNIDIYKMERGNKTVAKMFEITAKKYPNKVAFYFEDSIWTFKEIEAYSNKVANYFKAEGFQRGDTIALLMESSPEYVCCWLGLSKIGVITALINHNLTKDPLTHSIQVGNSKALIFGTELRTSVENVRSKLNVKLYQFHEKVAKTDDDLLENVVNLRDVLEDISEKSPKDEINRGSFNDKLVYIYTSGTTGLPKAAVITNNRFFMMAIALHYMVQIRENDNIYDPLPLYHSAGGMVGVGQALLKGVTVTIRKKFSASGFWKDCNKYKCTVAQYIGETCRYILAVNDKSQMNNTVRAMFGNGLRPQIWKNFVDRFGVKEIYEFYGATEGNSNLVNIDSTPGCVGFIPRYARHIYPVATIKCDEATGQILRNKYGFCERCRPGEHGILVGKINNKRAINNFTGYADKDATEKKIIRNVFSKGDLYFNSGDILVQDEFGYYYFKDRTGDTFRWKGENVATSEVEAVISNVVELKDAVVYGVLVPETDGRAGMAAIVDTENTLNFEKLESGLREHLPGYAIPIFVRVMKSVPLTGTFKLKKHDLQEEGFNLNRIKDTVYFYNSKAGKYLRLTEDLYNDIITNKIRV